MTMTHSRNKYRPIRALSIIDQVEEGKEFTFICYSDGDIKSWWTPFLKAGFRHCFIIHWNGQLWQKLEKSYGCFEASPMLWIDKLFIGTFNLEPYYRHLGYTVQVVDLKNRNPEQMRVKQLFAPNTCVEFVKDFLGLSAYFVNTPYQLYRHLEG